MSAATEYEVILGNSNKRFSGVTSTMLQTLEHQHTKMSIAVLGKHHLPAHLSANAVSFFELARICRKPLSSGKYRVFHARRNDEMIQALVLKHLFRTKIRILFTSTAQRYHSRFTRFLMSKVDMIISTCQAAAKYLRKPPSAIVAHGIDTQAYKPPSQERADSPIEIGMFGRVRPQKGTDIFVRAAIELFKAKDNIHATIVGAIAEDQKDFVLSLQQEIDDAGLSDRIRFTGELPFEDIAPLFQGMHLVAALSTNEGFGLTVLEAMSSGCAVLASDAGAWPDIIEPGKHGEIVPAGDAKAAAQALKILTEDVQKLKAIGKAGRSHIIEHYSIEQEADALCDIYLQLQSQ